MEMICVDWFTNTMWNVEVLGKPDLNGYVKCRGLAGDDSNFHHTAELFPMEYLEEVKGLIDTRAKLKAAYDESIGLVYELNNKLYGKKWL